MKKLLIFGACAVLGLDLAWHGVSNLLEAKDRSLYKRVLADARSVVTVLESFRAGTGSYPATWSADELATMVAPTYIRKLDTRDMRYFSDGKSYVLLMGFPRGSYSAPLAGGGPIEVRNGIVLSAPAWLNIAPSGHLVASMEDVQPNNALDLSVRSVTRVAESATRAPVRSAGHRHRWTDRKGTEWE